MFQNRSAAHFSFNRQDRTPRIESEKVDMVLTNCSDECCQGAFIFFCSVCTLLFSGEDFLASESLKILMSFLPLRFTLVALGGDIVLVLGSVDGCSYVHKSYINIVLDLIKRKYKYMLMQTGNRLGLVCQKAFLVASGKLQDRCV